MAGRWIPVHSRPTWTRPKMIPQPATRIATSIPARLLLGANRNAFAWPHIAPNRRAIAAGAPGDVAGVEGVGWAHERRLSMGSV